MKILIVNELLISGGAEQSCLKMKKLLQRQNDVVYLTFDNEFEKKINEVEDKKNIVNIKLGNKRLNRFIFNIFLYRRIRKKIIEINPDKIILNNLSSSPITQLRAMKGYDVYQVIRDYYAVCPKSTSIKKDFSVCSGYKFNNCYKTCGKSLKIFMRLHLIRKMEILRKKIVKRLISPSEKLNKYLLDFGYDSCCINNPMDINDECKNNEKELSGGTKKYVYLGAVNEIKGIYKFIEAFNVFSKDKDVNLTIIGKCSENADEEKLDKYLMNNTKIKYLGYKAHNEVVKLLKNFDFIVVPSLWIENYPTTALEGMLYKCLVLGSNRGGIPEIVGDDRGFLFNILDNRDIENVLNKTYSISKDNYKEIIERAYEYVCKNNSYEKYYKNIMNIL